MRREILASGVAVGAIRLAGMGMGLLVTIVIGRTLGPEGLGTYGYAVIVLSLLAVPMSYGWSALMLRRFSAARHDLRWMEPKGMLMRGTQFACAISLSMLAVAFAAVHGGLAPPLAALGGFVLVLLAVVLFVDQISAMRLAVLRGLNHPVWGQAPEMLARPALILTVFGAIWFSSGRAATIEYAFSAMAAAACAAAAIGALVLWSKGPASLWQAKPEFRTREWMASAAVLGGNSGLILLNSYADVLILGAMGSMEQVGIYRIATQVALLSGFVYSALNMLAAPRFAFLRAAGEREALQRSAVFMARLALLGALPLPLVFFFAGPRILAAVFGVAFVDAQTLLIPLFVAQIVNAGVGMASSLIISSGRESRLVVLTLGALIVNVALSVLLIPQLGGMGAALANMAAAMLWNLAMWILALRTLGIDTSVLGLVVRSRETAL